MKWTRPESVPFPSVWRRFEGAKPFPNGKRPRYRVQDFTENYRDDVLKNMRENFLPDEPLSYSLGLADDEVAVADMFAVWNEFMDRKLVLICLLENRDELGDDSLPVLVGCNMTGPKQADDHSEEPRSPIAKKIFDFIHYTESNLDVFNRYGVDVLMYAMGLSVDRRFRGQGIGLEILKSRYEMGRAVGIGLTMTVFTAIGSQKQAERAGFETIYEIAYEDYKVDGEVVFKITSPKTMKIMAARIT
ncbi:UNVERIFIED_CONTAM: hypothetical protein PYX00_004461 [Menopon gallinae]|uniref:N-acetyltransferase domain-containing protein n=1 Tax=Menopon gallinae TaxID=328185 RepID=A0AAW2I494_9NEOP